MKKLALAILLATLSLPAFGDTKPTDMVVILNQSDPEPAPARIYKKAWKDLSMDASTRQKILQKERELENEEGAKFKVYAVRVDLHLDKGPIITAAMYCSQFQSAIYDVRFGHLCVLSLSGNGGYVSGDKNCWLG